MNVLRVLLSSTKVDPNLRKFIGWRVSVAEAAPSLAISKEPPVPAAPSFHQFAAFVAPDYADPIRHFLLQEWMERYAKMFANKMDQRLLQLLREGW